MTGVQFTFVDQIKPGRLQTNHQCFTHSRFSGHLVQPLRKSVQNRTNLLNSTTVRRETHFVMSSLPLLTTEARLPPKQGLCIEVRFRHTQAP
jgi:hypothetical protein